MSEADKDQKAIDSMADAMLDGLSGKKEEPKKSSFKYHGKDYNTDRTTYSGKDFGTGHTTDQPRSSHTTHKGKGNKYPYTSVYDDRSIVRQAPSDKAGALKVSHMRSAFVRLEAPDVEALDMDKLMKRIEATLLDGLEQQNWMLLGEAEAFMFRNALDSNMRAALRAFCMKLMMNDVMRDRTKPRIK